MLFLYVDNTILVFPDKKKASIEIQSLMKDFALTDDGELKDYLEIHFTKHLDGSIELNQPRMINRVLKLLNLHHDDQFVKKHNIPASPHCLLDKETDGKPREQDWNYRFAMGCLLYIQAVSQPDITMAVQ